MAMELKVNASGEEHMKFYEHGRLYQYRDAKIGYYSNLDLRLAYEAWANAEPGNRLKQWESYCDVRDGYALGTNKAIRQKHEKSSIPDIGGPRYIKVMDK